MSGVVPVSGADMAPAWRALAASFDADPMFRFLFPRDLERGRWLELLMALALHQCEPGRLVFAPSIGPEAGAIGLIGPGDFPPDPQLLRFLLRRDRPGFCWPRRRARRVGFAALRMMDEAHISERHLYVMVVGLHPRYRGRGLGGALMEEACRIADQRRVATYLETSNEVNLEFYRRYGFELRSTLRPPGGAPPIWTMRRPRGAAA